MQVALVARRVRPCAGRASAVRRVHWAGARHAAGAGEARATRGRVGNMMACVGSDMSLQDDVEEAGDKVKEMRLGPFCIAV